MQLGLQELALACHLPAFFLRQEGLSAPFVAQVLRPLHGAPCLVDRLFSLLADFHQIFLRLPVGGRGFHPCDQVVQPGYLLLVHLEVAVGLQIVEDGWDKVFLLAVHLSGVSLQVSCLSVPFYNQDAIHLPFGGIRGQTALQIFCGGAAEGIRMVVERAVEPDGQRLYRGNGMELHGAKVRKKRRADKRQAVLFFRSVPSRSCKLSPAPVRPVHSVGRVVTCARRLPQRKRKQE